MTILMDRKQAAREKESTEDGVSILKCTYLYSEDYRILGLNKPQQLYYISPLFI